MKILVRYYDVENNESQYEDLDLAAMKSREICLARYIKAKGPYAGNPYIEALPLPRSAEDIANDYNNSVKPVSIEEIETMSALDKEFMVDTLNQVRFRLPFHKLLETAFYSALVRSYAARKTVHSRLDSLTMIIGNSKEECHSILFGDSAEATDGSFCLCGASGSGKTAALNVLLSHYPQVIRHPEYDNTIQIVYLAVNCIPNSNLNVLCDAVGDAIDKALGNIEPFYYEIVRLKSVRLFWTRFSFCRLKAIKRYLLKASWSWQTVLKLLLSSSVRPMLVTRCLGICVLLAGSVILFLLILIVNVISIMGISLFRRM